MLVHAGGPRAAGVLTKLRKLPTVTEHKSAELRPSEFPRFVAAEVQRPGARIDDDAACVLVQAVGQDLRSLAAAAHQLASDFPGEPSEGRGSSSTSAAGPRPSRSRSPTPRSPAAARRRSRSCAGRSTPARRRCWSPALRGRGARSGPLQGRPAGHARGRPGPRGRRTPWKLRSCASSPAAGARPGWPGRSGRSPRPTPTSRARPATRPTRSSDWCSRSPRLRDLR